jgi:hypothetical protein
VQKISHIPIQIYEKYVDLIFEKARRKRRYHLLYLPQGTINAVKELVEVFGKIDESLVKRGIEHYDLIAKNYEKIVDHYMNVKEDEWEVRTWTNLLSNLRKEREKLEKMLKK